MKFILIILFFIQINLVFSQSNQFLGSWIGKIKTTGVELRIAFHITEKEGITITKMDSPDQNSFGNSAYNTVINDSSIVIDLPLIGAKYIGIINNDVINGEFNQAGLELPLVLNRFDGVISAPKRPQQPTAPFDYEIKEVTIKTADEKVKLSGTLTIPKGKGPFPAVVLVSGSGPQDRNEELMGHQPFLVLADHLTKNGIVVLRYDDRGVGKSTGDFNVATSFDFADDAEAAFKLLLKQKKINPLQIGILGHSEGGLIAPIVASRNKDVKFIISMAGPSIPGSEIILDQQELIMRISETDENEINQQQELNKKILDFITLNVSSSNLQNELSNNIETWVKEINYLVPKHLSAKTFAKQTAYSFTTNWMKTFITTSPDEYIKSLTIPILALFGEKDLQVSPRANLIPMQQLLQSHKQSEVYVFPNLNHLFQTANTGSPSEYQLIEETLSPIFLDFVTNWIKQLK